MILNLKDEALNTLRSGGSGHIELLLTLRRGVAGWRRLVLVIEMAQEVATQKVLQPHGLATWLTWLRAL